MNDPSKGAEFAGKHAWNSIHSFAAAYTPDKASQFRQFIELHCDLFPCEKCRANLKLELQRCPIDDFLDSNHKLFWWTYLLHDQVNRRLGKVSPPYDTIKQYYFKKFSSECSHCRL